MGNILLEERSISFICDVSRWYGSGPGDVVCAIVWALPFAMPYHECQQLNSTNSFTIIGCFLQLHPRCWNNAKRQ